MQAQRRFKTQDAVELTFKRHILEKTSAFASAPQEDLYRVQMLGMMLDRYDELLQSGLTEQNACAHVLDAFDGLALQMQEMGFEELEPGEPASGWPPLGDRDVETYLCEQDAYRHRIALGAACFSASLSPVIVTNALTELFGFGGDAAGFLGVGGFFGMIALGVYLIVTAVRPKDEKRIREGRFSLSKRIRRQVERMSETKNARGRKGRGVVLIITSLLPVLAGAALDEFLWQLAGEGFSSLGVAGMFLMIAAGVYELVMASGEKKMLKRLLDREEE